MLLTKPFAACGCSSYVRRQQTAGPLAHSSVPALRSLTGQRKTTHHAADSTTKPLVPRATMGAETSMFQSLEGQQEPEVLGWQRAISKVVLGALFFGLAACLALIWGQAPSPLVVQGTTIAQIVDGMGGSVLATVAATLTKQQALALGAAVFMFLSTAAGPMLTLGNRNRPAPIAQAPSEASSNTTGSSSQQAAAPTAVSAARPAVAVAATLTAPASPPAVKPSPVAAASGAAATASRPSVSSVTAASSNGTAQAAQARPSLASRAAALRSGPLAPAEPTTIPAPSGDLSRPTKSGRMPTDFTAAAAVAAAPAAAPSIDRPGKTRMTAPGAAEPVVAAAAAAAVADTLSRPGKTRFMSPAAEPASAGSVAGAVAGSPSPAPSGLSVSSTESLRSPSPVINRPGARSRSPSPSSSPSVSPSRVNPDGSLVYTVEQLASVDEADVIAILASKSPSVSPAAIGARGNRAGRSETPPAMAAAVAVAASPEPPAVRASSPAVEAVAGAAKEPSAAPPAFSRGGGSSRLSAEPAVSKAASPAGGAQVSTDRPSRSRGAGLKEPVVVVAAAAWAAVEVFTNMTKPNSNANA